MKKWMVNQGREAAAQNLSREAGVSPAFARLLAARGFSDAASVQAFLNGEQDFAPLSYAGMREAVERIERAVEEFEFIAVYGDYDADGVTATAMLYSYLESIGANVMYYIPDRETEGYGLNCEAIRTLAEREVSLIVTVDNGVASVSEIAFAATLGVDVVVTDHHRPQEELPAACAVVDPHRSDCRGRCKALSGVGVAFILILALEGEGCDVQGLLDNYADLVAIGTIGDVVPLVGENRLFVREGLRLLSQTDRLGLRALIERAGMENRQFTAVSVAFTIVPRINATGRMGSPDRAVRLLLSEYPDEAEELAEEICADNDERRRIEAEIFEEALAQFRREPGRLLERLLVADGENWHPGVIGIVASRLTERFGKPCFVISRSDDGTAKGSGRSVVGFDLFAAVSHCAPLLTKFGGHPMAAGLTLPAEKLPEFRRMITRYAVSQPAAWPCTAIDCVVSPQEATVELARETALLEPFGTGNPPPVFGLFDAVLSEITPVGGGKHLRLMVTKDSRTLRCMRFNVSPEDFPYRPGDRIDLAFSLEEKEFMGKPELSVIVRELLPAGADSGALLRSWARYEAARRGAVLPPAVWEEQFPTRDSFALLYRFLREENGFSGEPEALWMRCGGRLPLGRLLLCLDVLSEHGLIQLESSGSLVRVRLLPVSGKVDLFSSKLLGSLKKSE